jgi:hypothetical protein
VCRMTRARGNLHRTGPTGRSCKDTAADLWRSRKGFFCIWDSDQWVALVDRHFTGSIARDNEWDGFIPLGDAALQ